MAYLTPSQGIALLTMYEHPLRGGALGDILTDIEIHDLRMEKLIAQDMGDNTHELTRRGKTIVTEMLYVAD